MADPIKVLIADDMSKKAVEILSNAGFTVDVRTGVARTAEWFARG